MRVSFDREFLSFRHSIFASEERVKYQYDMTRERDRRNQEAFKMRKALEERDLEIAKNMLALGIDVELIEKSTGLSADEIKSLQ